MKQNIEHFLDRLAVISDLMARESNELDTLYNLGSTTALADHAEILMSEPHPASMALQAFMLELPPDVLFSILVLMLAGRDNEDVLEAVDSHCGRNVSCVGASRSIREKYPRMEYIAKGMSRLGAERLPDLLTRVREKLEEVGIEDDRTMMVSRFG